MTRTGVTSSSLASIGYSPSKRVLEVEFKHGAIYRYLGVPPEIFEAFLTAESKGTFFNQTIKNRFVYTRATE